MPVETRISEEFGQLVGQVIGEDTYGKAAIKTGISQAYLLTMRRGKVPTEAIVGKFAAGYGVDEEMCKALLVAAGYAKGDTIKRVEDAIRDDPRLSEEDRTAAVAFLKRLLDKSE